jgi:hypothetical protein
LIITVLTTEEDRQFDIAVIVLSIGSQFVLIPGLMGILLLNPSGRAV